MGLPHVLVRFYTNPDGRAARRTTLVVLCLLGGFYLLPTVYGALARVYTPDLLLTGRTDTAVLLLPERLVGGTGRPAAHRAGDGRRVRRVPLDVVGTHRVGRGRAVAGRAARLGARLPAGRRAGAVTVPFVLSLGAASLDVADVVGLAFAVAASSFCPLLVLGIWWRGLTDVGAIAGLLTGGGLATARGRRRPSPASTATAGSGALLAQPAAWTVPIAFAVMVLVSLRTPHRVAPDVARTMVRLHAPESVELRDRRARDIAVEAVVRLPDLGAPFWRLWTASIISAAGDGLTFVAVPLLAARLTQRPRAGRPRAGRGVHARGCCWGWSSGALADRWDRLRIMAVTDLVRSVLFGAFAVAVVERLRHAAAARRLRVRRRPLRRHEPQRGLGVPPGRRTPGSAGDGELLATGRHDRAEHDDRTARSAACCSSRPSRCRSRSTRSRSLVSGAHRAQPAQPGARARRAPRRRHPWVPPSPRASGSSGGRSSCGPCACCSPSSTASSAAVIGIARALRHGDARALRERLRRAAGRLRCRRPGRHGLGVTRPGAGSGTSGVVVLVLAVQAAANARHRAGAVGADAGRRLAAGRRDQRHVERRDHQPAAADRPRRPARPGHQCLPAGRRSRRCRSVPPSAACWPGRTASRRRSRSPASCWPAARRRLAGSRVGHRCRRPRAGTRRPSRGRDGARRGPPRPGRPRR